MRVSGRTLVKETPVAIVCNGSTVAVMMASPADLGDFAFGFCRSEGIVTSADEIEDVEIVRHASGIEARLWMDVAAANRMAARRRTLLGPVGCGLCGIESLDQALPALPRLAEGSLRLGPADIAAAMRMLRDRQPDHDRTGASHAAGFYVPGKGILAVREDVGRHNALDKLIGHLTRTRVTPATGAILLTSRVSAELVQKTATCGVPALIAASAPTDTAMRLATEANLTLVTRARGGAFDIVCGSRRVDGTARSAPDARDPNGSGLRH